MTRDPGFAEVPVELPEVPPFDWTRLLGRGDIGMQTPLSEGQTPFQRAEFLHAVFTAHPDLGWPTGPIPSGRVQRALRNAVGIPESSWARKLNVPTAAVRAAEEGGRQWTAGHSDLHGSELLDGIARVMATAASYCKYAGIEAVDVLTDEERVVAEIEADEKARKTDPYFDLRRLAEGAAANAPDEYLVTSVDLHGGWTADLALRRKFILTFNPQQVLDLLNQIGTK